MGKETGIAWTNHTFNPWFGCTKVSPGCAHCYAEAMVRRYKWGDIWGPGKSRRTFDDKHWRDPIRWNAAAEKKGERATVFCGSMMDWAEAEAPADERAKIWPLIRKTPHLFWLMLTKRPDLAFHCLPEDWSAENYPNVAMGTSIENNDYVWRAVEITAIPAAVHFISAEPLLGPLDKLDLTGIDWLIVGGESGSGWRKMEKEWAEDLRDRCEEADVAFFFKQDSGFRSGMRPDLLGQEHKTFPERFSLPVV